MRLSAAKMTNWLPKSQGAMIIRPGTKYLGSSFADTGGYFIPFVAAASDLALLEMTDSRMRIWIDDALMTRPTRITGGPTLFGTGGTDTGNWKNDSSNGGTIGFGDTGMVLNAVNRGGLAKATQKIALGNISDKNVELGFDIHIVRGPVTFRCGNDTGNDTYVSETELRTGYHKIACTPTDTGGLHFTFQSSQDVDRIVGSLTMTDTGVVSVTTPWAYGDLDNIRYDQSADVIFVACSGKKQHRIERRGTGRSWSVVEYQSDNGPFSSTRTAAVKLKVGATSGNTTLTADKPFFRSTHVGALFYLFTTGYSWTFKLSDEDQYTDPITVTGISDAGANYPDDRSFSYTISGTWVGTLNLLHSVEDKIAGPYTVTSRDETSTEDITVNATETKNKKEANALNNNLIEYFKVGFLPGNYTSGVATVQFAHNGSGDFGVVRVTEFTSSTSVKVEVLRSPSTTAFTNDWREGLWSDAQDWPTDVALYEGRLNWFGKSHAWMSVSDDYENFDDATEGDAAPIDRILGSGPVDNITFSAPLSRLLLGTASSILSLRSTTFDEPLTADNMTAKPSTTQGAASIKAVTVDSRAIYVHRSLTRLFELFYNPDAYDYVARELTILAPQILGITVVDIAVQRQPDTRVHCVLADGTVAILTYEPAEELLCWSTWQTTGTVERAVVLPGTTEDAVYYHVKRTINAATVRYLERWATEAECAGDTGLSWLADCAVSYTDTGRTTAPSGFGHLEAASIVLWSNDTGQATAGKDLSVDDANGNPTLYAVAAGIVTSPSDQHHYVGGLPYTADYVSTKLAYAAQGGTALTQVKRVAHVGLVLNQTHNNGLLFGGDTGTLDRLPLVDQGANVDVDKIYTAYDEKSITFPGDWNTDSRIYLRGRAPRPVTVMGAVVNVATNEKV